MIKADDGKNYTGNDRYEGYCVELAERLSLVVNFTYELRMVKDNNFGSKGLCQNQQLIKSVNKLLISCLIKTPMEIGMVLLVN